MCCRMTSSLFPALLSMSNSSHKGCLVLLCNPVVLLSLGCLYSLSAALTTALRLLLDSESHWCTSLWGSHLCKATDCTQPWCSWTLVPPWSFTLSIIRRTYALQAQLFEKTFYSRVCGILVTELFFVFIAISCSEFIDISWFLSALVWENGTEVGHEMVKLVWVLCGVG